MDDHADDDHSMAEGAEDDSSSSGEEEEEEEEEEEIVVRGRFNPLLEPMLRDIERNNTDDFTLSNPIDDPFPTVHATVTDARVLAEALTRNTSVHTFCAEIHNVPTQVIDPFLDYIRSSPANLLCLRVGSYLSHGAQESEEARQIHRARLDRFYSAAQDNTSIETLNVDDELGSPSAMYHILANPTSALTQFSVDFGSDGCPDDMAESIALGIRMSSSRLQKVAFEGFGRICWTTLLGGVGLSSVESVCLAKTRDRPDDDLWKAIKNILYFTKIKKLEICFTSGMDARIENQGNLIFAEWLLHPASRLQQLELRSVSLIPHGAGGAASNSAESAPNATLQVLSLLYVGFYGSDAVRLLWNLVGLKVLTLNALPDIRRPHLRYGAEHRPSLHVDNEESEQNSIHTRRNWADFIRHNRMLERINMQFRYVTSPDLLEGTDYLYGVLEGAQQLESLKVIKITGLEMGQDSCQCLSRMLQATSSLEMLHLERGTIQQVASTLLSECIGRNHTLKVLHFDRCGMEVDSLVDFLSSVCVNQTLQVLIVSELHLISGPFHVVNGAFLGEYLARLFQDNKSLIKLELSLIDFRGGSLATSLLGLHGNVSLKTLLFDFCVLDNDALTALARTLVSEDVSLEEIGLPKRNPERFNPASANIEEGTRAFVASLAHEMSSISKVHFGRTMTTLHSDGELRRLLLSAVIKNRKLVLLGNIDFDAARASDDVSVVSDMKQVEFYLKLNQFGRRILDSPNVPGSIWPRVLSRMTRQLEDVDALFFFTRQYFSRQQQQQQPTRSHRNDPNNQFTWPRL